MANVVYLQEPKKEAGSRIPLFDRLANLDTEALSESPIQKFQDLKELEISIERELLHLLGTQTKFKRDDYMELIKNPMNFALPGMYGVPEFTYFEASNSDNWKMITRLLTKVISYYEPRLKNVSVSAEDFDGQRQQLQLNIIAELNIPEFRQEATFSLALKVA